MPSAWTKILFGLKKRYGTPILFLLYHKKELTFDQIYDMCSEYIAKERGEGKVKKGILRERGKRYVAISRGSVSQAITELKNKHYVTKAARLSEKGRSYAVYMLSPEIKQLMDEYVKAK